METPTLRRAVMFFPAFLLAVLPAHLTAQLVNGRFISSISSRQKFDTVDASRRITRAYQSVLLDIVQGDIGLHTHLQGAVQVQKRLDEGPDLRAWHLYGRWRDIGGAADLSVGRLPFYAGAGSGTLDGALLSLRPGDNAWRVTLYGGANIPADLSLNSWRPLRENHLFGAQVYGTPAPGLRAGLSYVKRHRERTAYWTLRPDSLYEPAALYVEPPPDREQIASGDALYRTDLVVFSGRYDHDLHRNQIQRARFSVRAQASDRLTVTGEFLHRSPRISYGSFFEVFAASPVNEFESGMEYLFRPRLRGFLRGAFVAYNGEESFRATAGFSHDNIRLSYRGSTGEAGELHSVALQGAFPLLERTLVPGASLSWSRYRTPGAPEHRNTVAASAGAALRPHRMVSADVRVQYLTNSIYRSDLRILGTLSFWFTERLTIL
ncbi:MAG: hypothetical protein WB626_10345 [Bacteroidota bacterium]